MATITRRARQLPASLTTSTPPGRDTIRRTGARSTTRLPSRAASRIETSCEPPTKRESWAPPAVLVRFSTPFPELK